MARRVRTTLLYVLLPIFFFSYVYYYYLENSIPFSINPPDIDQEVVSAVQDYPSIFNTPNDSDVHHENISSSDAWTITQGNHSGLDEGTIIQGNHSGLDEGIMTLPAIDEGTMIQGNHSSVDDGIMSDGNKKKKKKKKKKKQLPEVVPVSPFSSISVLLPDWEILVIVSPEDTPALANSLPGHEHDFVCVHYTGEVSPGKFSGNLSFPDRVTFRCLLPERARKRLPFKEPSLLLPDQFSKNFVIPPILLIWSNLVYDSLTPDDGNDDVIVFAKGLIKKQDIVRNPSEFECIFGEDLVNGVRTPVKTSSLEVFRCQRPKLTYESTPVKVSLNILTEKRVVPSVAYYTPTPRKLSTPPNEKALLCACTMVYNVAKFLKEWVYYYSRIGVERFILYDNGSDDDLETIVSELNQQGYDVSTYFWLWQKTQEAGFSHSALYAKDSCKWMMYVDVDEFVYAPTWSSSPTPSILMLQHLVNGHIGDKEMYDSQGRHQLFEHSKSFSTNSPSLKLHLAAAGNSMGQISIGCHEFGPSNQSSHPEMGVTQGYNCRMSTQNRHKSIVLLEAVDYCLSNVIHHFKLKKEYKTVLLSIKKMMLNHYKYQAWPEFKAKFKRRVSAYVVDWNSQLNLNSQDRPKGIDGSTTMEPENWRTSYCQVHDNRLRDLVRRWFATKLSSGYRMPWQR